MRRFGDFPVALVEPEAAPDEAAGGGCFLCLSPCSELGRELKCAALLAGELGMLEEGELLLDEFTVEFAESEPDE